jgi:aspartyl-tRNA(Asn)/glutamyl-tRNA(Gln) amidotransferase subunit B
MPLLEIVSEPDLCSSREAFQYLTDLKAILQYLDVSDCNMEEGSLRCDANVSVRKAGEPKLGTKVEIKNMNSFRAVEKAVTYEIGRQTEVLEQGGRIIQETRLWDEGRGETASMRSKEHAHDYRYFPEPDLVPFSVPRDRIEEIRKALPELPKARRERFQASLGLSLYDASVLVSDKELGDYFEDCVRHKVGPKLTSNWIQSELLAFLRASGAAIKTSKVTAERLAGLVRLIEDGTISGKIAKDVLPIMFETGEPAEKIVKEKGLLQLTDAKLIEEVVERVIAAHAKVVGDFKTGKDQAAGFLVGQVMKETKGRANPKLVNEILKKKLS